LEWVPATVTVTCVSPPDFAFGWNSLDAWVHLGLSGWNASGFWVTHQDAGAVHLEFYRYRYRGCACRTSATLPLPAALPQVPPLPPGCRSCLPITVLPFRSFLPFAPACRSAAAAPPATVLCRSLSAFVLFCLCVSAVLTWVCVLLDCVSPLRSLPACHLLRVAVTGIYLPFCRSGFTACLPPPLPGVHRLLFCVHLPFRSAPLDSTCLPLTVYLPLYRFCLWVSTVLLPPTVPFHTCLRLPPAVKPACLHRFAISACLPAEFISCSAATVLFSGSFCRYVPACVTSPAWNYRFTVTACHLLEYLRGPAVLLIFVSTIPFSWVHPLGSCCSTNTFR